MKTITAILGLLILPLIAPGQSRELTDEQVNKSGATRLILADSLPQAKAFAIEDITNGIPFLLLQSGISPVVYSSDKAFEEKYKVHYYESGCTGAKEQFAFEYNKTVFDHLKANYGRKWKSEVRKDVLGFSEWKRARK